MQQSMEFLTAEESARVDAALLSSKEKFSTRLAIYALRCLKQIAQETDLSVEAIAPEQIRAWIEKDENIKKQLEVDASFQNFFTQLAISALRPLKQISQEADVRMEHLTVEQVVEWFEKQAKIRLEKG